MNKSKLIFDAVKKVFLCNNFKAEKWLDDNSNHINVNNVVDLESAIIEVEDVKTKLKWQKY